MLYCIKIKSITECWFADWEGDPGRTLVKDNAKTFTTKKDADKKCNILSSQYPTRSMFVDIY